MSPRRSSIAWVIGLLAALPGCKDGGTEQPNDASVDALVASPDAGADAASPDAGEADAEAPDAEAPDAEAPDAEAPDAEAPDASVPDANVPDAGPGSERAIVSFTEPQFDNTANDLTGFRFTVGAAAITVTDLGMYDDLFDGLGEAHDVGIFDVTSQALVVRASIPAGQVATLDGDFRFVPVTPVVLSANTTYVILMYRPTDVDAICYFVTDLVVSPLIHYDADIAKNFAGGLVFLNTPFDIPSSWFGPNFKAHL